MAAPGFAYKEDMNTKLYITAPFPPSVNHYMGYRAIMKNGRPMAVPYKTAEAVAFCKEFSGIVEYEVAQQGWDVPLDGSKHIYVDATFYFPRTRMDCNNYWKVLLDTITDTHLVWLDDDIVCERAQAIYYDSKNPRIELFIHPVDYTGIFKDDASLQCFEDNCRGCTRYARNCSILRTAKEGRVQEDIVNEKCCKYKAK